MATYVIKHHDDTSQTIEADRFSVEDYQVSFFKGRERVAFVSGVKSIFLQGVLSADHIAAPRRVP